MYPDADFLICLLWLFCLRNAYAVLLLLALYGQAV